MDIAVLLYVPGVKTGQFAAERREFGRWYFVVFALFGVAKAR
jgi:hypothetical protein